MQEQPFNALKRTLTEAGADQAIEHTVLGKLSTALPVRKEESFSTQTLAALLHCGWKSPWLNAC